VRLTIAAVAVLGVLAVAAFVLWPRPGALTVSGSVTVHGEHPQVVTANELTCVTGGGYDDIREGAQVVVTDASGATIAVGRLGFGSWKRNVGCVFLFELEVPGGHDFYGIEVSHRGRLQYPAEQLAAPLDLTLG